MLIHDTHYILAQVVQSQRVYRDEAKNDQGWSSSRDHSGVWRSMPLMRTRNQ
jgi:hypothetical protein